MKSYLDLLRDVIRNGESHDDRTGVGTVSVFGRQWRHDMREGFPLLTTKKIPLRWVFEELRWFLSGSTNEKDLRKQGVDIWAEWATPEQCAKFDREPGDLGPVYGKLWRSFEGVDQIKYLLKDIEQNPNSRRLLVTGWHPALQTRVALPPCHTVWQIKCHPGGDMSLHLYARSIDIFLGLPFNVASYALLLKMLAQVTGRHARDLVISFGDLHLYKTHFQQAETQLGREPSPLPDLEVCDMPQESALDRLLAYRWENIVLDRYHPHPKIEAPVAI